MAHFYGFIHGSRGEATRMGSKGSGFRAWAQTWISRITISLRCDETDDDKTYATLSFGGGGSSGYSGRSLSFCPDELVAALDANDPAINRIWARIERDFKRLDEQAPKAIKRQERRRKIERQQYEAEQARIAEERRTIIRELTPSEKVRIERLCPHVEWDNDGNPTDMFWVSENRANLRYAEDGKTVLLNARMPNFNSLRSFVFDVTHGQWVFPFEPDEIGINDTYIRDSGYGYKIKEVSA